MIDQPTIDKIFDAAPIEEVVGQFITLKRSGANYKALCPFHDDHNASMVVSPSKGIFKCFSCNTGGNAIVFIMEHEGLSFPLAARFLAEMYNIEMDESQVSSEEMKESQRVKEGILSCLKYAMEFYATRINEGEGKFIYRPYLLERGIQQSTIDNFKIGLSGTGRTEFIEVAVSSGYTVQQLFDSGLAKKIDERGTVIKSNLRDTFIERILFPILNITGKCIGFGGRIIKNNEKIPKYLNSPETLVYEKRKQLYGLSHAKTAIRKYDSALVVEGYMDVVSLSQNNIENVVASSGTSFTEAQARLLKRFTSNAYLLFDGDTAGVRASLATMRVLLSVDMNVYAILFSAEDDPDSFVQKNGPDALKDRIDSESKDFVDLIIYLRIGTSTKASDVSAAAKEIAEKIAVIPDQMKRVAYINKASKLLKIPHGVFTEEVNKVLKPGQKKEVVSDLNEPEKVIHEEKNLLHIIIEHGHKEFTEGVSVAQYIFKDLEGDGVWPSTPLYLEIFKEANDHLKRKGSISQEYFTRNIKTSNMAAEALEESHMLFGDFKAEESITTITVKGLNYMKLGHINRLILENRNNIAQEQDEGKQISLMTARVNLQNIKNQIKQSL